MGFFGRARKLLAYRKEKERKYGFLLSIVLVLEIVVDNLEDIVRRRDARKRKMPSILLITLPKSGSMYIYNILMDRYGYRPGLTGSHGFPYAPIDPAKLKKFAIGCAIDQAHYMPSVKNLTLLKREGINKVVVHFRDPRQALLSLVHYLNKEHERDNVFGDQDVELPLDYFDKTLEQKIDIAIDLYYPHFIEFVDRWLSCGKDSVPRWGIDILFTEFRKMKSAPESFFEVICAFYGIKEVGEYRMQPSDEAQSHDRKGELEEWRRVFTPGQIARTSAMITKEMLERFGWSRR